MAGGSPQHITVNTSVVTVTFDYAAEYIEVLNVNGAGEVYFRFDGSDPGVGAEGSEVLPAAISSMRGYRQSYTNPGGGRTVKLIGSTNGIKVSVAARTLKARSS